MDSTDARGTKRFQFSLRFLLVCTLIIGAVLGLVIPYVAVRRETARCEECASNLKQIAFCIHNHYAFFKRYPKAIRNDRNGKPIHGWHIGILRYTEQRPIYDQYRFAEPWNSQHNLTLAYRTISDNTGRRFMPGTPDYCVCPSHRRHTKTRFTNYTVITGPGTLFPPKQRITHVDVTDGTANTLLAVEIDHPNVHWLQPWALSIETMSFRVNDRSTPSISSQHRGGANVAFVDGEVYFMSEEIDPQQLRALITISGGESVSRDELIDKGLLRKL